MFTSVIKIKTARKEERFYVVDTKSGETFENFGKQTKTWRKIKYGTHINLYLVT